MAGIEPCRACGADVDERCRDDCTRDGPRWIALGLDTHYANRLEAFPVNIDGHPNILLSLSFGDGEPLNVVIGGPAMANATAAIEDAKQRALANDGLRWERPT